MFRSSLSDAQERAAGSFRFFKIINNLFWAVVLMLVPFFGGHDQAKAATNGAIGVVSGGGAGLCTQAATTSFNAPMSFTGSTDDGGNLDIVIAYLVDGNNTVIHIDVLAENVGSTLNSTRTPSTRDADPVSGPFKYILHDDTDAVADFAPGTTFNAPAGEIVAEREFDANALNNNCPGAPGGGTSSSLDNQQSSITSTIITQQTGTFISGVTDNVTSLFSGAGSDPRFNPSGFTSNSSQFSGDFYVQSTGLKRWINDKRLALAQKRRQKHQAALGLKSSEAPAPKKDDTKLGVTRAGDEIVDEDLIGQYNFWIKGSATYYNGEGHTFDGTTFDVVTGVDYRLSADVIAGMLIGYGRTDFDINDNGTAGDFEADGYSVGPYFGLKLSDNVFVDGLFVYTRSDYENSAGTTTGDFDADRITGALNIRGRYEYDGMIIEPGVGIIYAREKQESYTDSGGTNHSALTIKTGRVSVGPKVTFAPYKLESSQISPWVAVRGEYDFSNQERAATSSLPDLSDFFSARASLGLDTMFEGGSKLSLKGDASGLFSDKYIGLGGQVRYDVPF